MRGALGFLLCGSMMLAACADDVATTPARRNVGDKSNPTNDPAQTQNPGQTSTTSAAVTACQAAAPATQLSDVKDARDLQIAGTGIFFKTGQAVNRVLKDGTNKKTIFTSENLTHSWADSKGLLIIEATDAGNPQATLRAFNAIQPQPTEQNPNPPAPAFPEYPVNPDGDPGGATSGTNFNAAGAQIFAADDNNYYILSEDGNGNQQITAVNRGNPQAQTILATSTKVITNPQIASSAIWYVEDKNRIFKVALATDDQPAGQPTEVFGLEAGCALAVNDSMAFCATGASIETRDLTGQSPKTLIQASASKAPDAPFGEPTYLSGQLFVRNVTPDADVKNIIRAISTGPTPDEKFVACNRGTIADIAVDESNVVFADDTGVFMTTR